MREIDCPAGNNHPAPLQACRGDTRLYGELAKEWSSILKAKLQFSGTLEGFRMSTITNS